MIEPVGGQPTTHGVARLGGGDGATVVVVVDGGAECLHHSELEYDLG